MHTQLHDILNLFDLYMKTTTDLDFDLESELGRAATNHLSGRGFVVCGRAVCRKGLCIN